MNGEKVLIVEDEPKIARLLSDYLRSAGYQTDTVDDGAEVMAAFEQFQPDLLLLDLMLPHRDGLDICRELRTRSSVPIIMVTARVDEIDRLLGLGVGADDYICKPFSPREVVARVQAALRRVSWQSQPDGSSPVLIDEDAMQARVDGQLLDLTPVEFRLLAVFASRPGRVFSRGQLMDHAYQDHRVVSDRTIDSHVKNLRQKLQTVSPDASPIQSVYGAGYRFDPTG
ncbi:MAG: response regulator [Pseudomonadota bacterium]